MNSSSLGDSKLSYSFKLLSLVPPLFRLMWFFLIFWLYYGCVWSISIPHREQVEIRWVSFQLVTNVYGAVVLSQSVIFCMNNHLILCLLIISFSAFNPSHPDPGRREKINIYFYFHTSLWCWKRFYEVMKALNAFRKPFDALQRSGKIKI